MSGGSLVSDGTAAKAGAANRWIGLDALRGLAILCMILVNNPGDWGHVYAPLQHAKWHGCTFTDLVFPTFLFCAGVAIVPALGAALSRGRSKQELAVRIGKRALLLVLLGLFVQSFPLVTFAEGKPLFEPLLTVRFPGVLQRIGVCYAIAALLFLYASERTCRRVLTALLVGYWPLLALTPTPDGGAPDLATTGNHLAGWLDRTVFGSHLYLAKNGGDYDPEGLLSTIPAIATALFGLACGRVLQRAGSREEAVRQLLLRGASWLALGVVWGWFFPINKALWTSSYAVFTAGIAACGLGLCVHLFEVAGKSRLCHPLLVYGRNALLVFVGSAVLARTLGRLVLVDSGPPPVSVLRWFHSHAFASWLDPHFASFLFACTWVLCWYAVLAVLYKKNIVWRV